MYDLGLREVWRSNWLDCIRELSDIAYQRETWLSTKPLSVHFTFVEFVECYYDAVPFGYDTLVRQRFVTPAEAKALMEFHQLLEGYEPPNDDPYDVETILTDRNWKAVVAAASDALTNLENQKPE